ncbi:MAG: hypothetical protein Q4G25_08150 [Paracoccus sp. (in: a-proteobacteria)]|nr:hypothetical protein [Paracoccus sp. (in: a-proteobacteria)]
MNSFADSEKRLVAALARIDQALDQRVTGHGHADEEGARLVAENADLRRELETAAQEVARLGAENEALRSRSDSSGTPDASAALQAELEALRAARAAEIAALDDIMSGLEALIARAPRVSDAPYAEDVAPAPGDVLSFDKNGG